MAVVGIEKICTICRKVFQSMKLRLFVHMPSIFSSYAWGKKQLHIKSGFWKYPVENTFEEINIKEREWILILNLQSVAFSSDPSLQSMEESQTQENGIQSWGLQANSWSEHGEFLSTDLCSSTLSLLQSFSSDLSWQSTVWSQRQAIGIHSRPKWTNTVTQ